MANSYLVKGLYRDESGSRNVVGLLCVDSTPSRGDLKALGFPSICTVESVQVATASDQPNTHPRFFHFDASPSPNRKIYEVSVSSDGRKIGKSKEHDFHLPSVLPLMSPACFEKHFASYWGSKCVEVPKRPSLNPKPKKVLR